MLNKGNNLNKPHNSVITYILCYVYVKIMEQKKLIEKLIKASNEIHKDRKPKAEYITLSEDFMQQQADERGISFDDMVKVIEEELRPKE